MRKSAFALALAGLFLLSRPALTHHSQSMYDNTKEASIKGVITKIEWTNPHTWFYMDQVDDQGKVVAKWEFESLSPNNLARAKWKRNTLQVGEKVTMVGWPQKDGVKRAHLNSVVLDGGKVLRPGRDPDNPGGVGQGGPGAGAPPAR